MAQIGSETPKQTEKAVEPTPALVEKTEQFNKKAQQQANNSTAAQQTEAFDPSIFADLDPEQVQELKEAAIKRRAEQNDRLNEAYKTFNTNIAVFNKKYNHLSGLVEASQKTKQRDLEKVTLEIHEITQNAAKWKKERDDYEALCSKQAKELEGFNAILHNSKQSAFSSKLAAASPVSQNSAPMKVDPNVAVDPDVLAANTLISAYSYSKQSGKLANALKRRNPFEDTDGDAVRSLAQH
jgi:hypothetical protein